MGIYESVVVAAVTVMSCALPLALLLWLLVQVAWTRGLRARVARLERDLAVLRSGETPEPERARERDQPEAGDRHR